MSDRSGDWIKQASRNLESSRAQKDDDFCEWSCFIAQQAAEKAIKALYQRMGREAWGHSPLDIRMDGLPERRENMSRRKTPIVRSVIQERSYNSVRIFWLDRERLRENILTATELLVNQHHEVTRVLLFGSLAENRATPSSDVDILIIVKESSCRFIDRSLPFVPYYQDIGVGSDIFVYTEKEAAEHSIPLLKTALRNGKILFERAPPPSR